jgi:outer membrane protein assembly factor BamB
MKIRFQWKSAFVGLVGVGLLLPGPGQASASETPWRVPDQPQLKRALEHAPILKTESLGDPARGVNVWERWMVPNPDGTSWDVLQIYFKEYYGPTWLFAVDLGTGQVKKQRLADGHQFYLSGRALGFDGKYYIATPSRQTWSMDLFVYDPANNTLEERGEIVHGLGGEVRPLVTGPDGRIYGTGTRDNRVGLYIYDPKLRKVVKDFGPVGPSHPNGAWSRYVMGVDDTHAYIASGMIPAWYLVAVNLQTGEEKVLLESPTERVMEIIEHFPGAFARIPQADGAPDKEYWLYHGEAVLMTNSTPPWPMKPSPWDKAVPKPEVYFDQIDPDTQGNALLWHLSREEAGRDKNSGWKSIRLEGVPTYPHRINPLSVLPDGRLYGTGDDYAGTFIFDPKSDQTTYCGPRTGLAPYTTIVCGGKLYLSGYSGGHLFVFDPARDWTLGKGGPPGKPAPDQGDARSNPRYLGDFDRTTRVGLMHSSVPGADGRIYFGGFGLRHYTGGGLGWYDPKTGKMDGFWKPLSGYAVQWLAGAIDGRLIVISTIRAADELNNNRAPEEAKLFVYDVSQQKIVREIVPIAKARTTGLILEVAHGRLLGLASHPQQRDQSVLYGVDLANGEVLFTKELPSPVSTDAYWPHWVDPSYEYHAFALGPDGFVWTYLKDVLVRIDTKDASVHVVGKIDPVGWPTFIGREVYLSGPEQLRRIRNLVPAQ